LPESSSEIRSLTSSTHEETVISEDGETKESRKEKVESGEKRSLKEDQELNQQPSFKRMRFEAISEEKSMNGFSRMRWQDMPKIKT